MHDQDKDVPRHTAQHTSSIKQPTASHDHVIHSHNVTEQAAIESNSAVLRVRRKHRQKKHDVTHKKGKKNRLIFWTQILLTGFLIVSIGLTIRAMELISIKNTDISWFQELQQGNYNQAADKFSTLASDAVGQVLDTNISTKSLMKDFNAALPQLKKAGYTLTELEVELGIPPKLIPHFYHDPTVHPNLEQSLDALKGNGIGTALMLALSKAGELQKELEVSGMQFSHIEVELGPIPSLKLQYKNNQAIEGYIHK